MAIKAINTNSIAPTFAANFKPSVVPFAIASNKFAPILSWETETSVLTESVWGSNIFAITIAPGAAITDAVSKCLA